ncbi:MAG: 16S rRNA (guanine(966)-N(2))-methyltransferase RsmD [Clostridia bacterium]|nr:16S rRNA (guanine(966)-N(2))-methyltransferase RsmD [Clostridia bacterium]
MRIITGIARGVRLQTLEGEATRPTAERVKEALFSMIQFDLEDAVVLDLFAGSGQLGLEALSRGASKAVFTDISSEATAIIKANAQKTRLFEKCRVLTMDHKDYIRAAAGKYKFDFIFLDPPYALKLIPEVLKKIAAADILNENGVIVCESEDDDILNDEKLTSAYEIIKQAKYGRIHLTLLKIKEG